MTQNKHTEEEALRLRKVIADWKIEFEVVSNLRGWQSRGLPHSDIFQQLLAIKDVKYAEYPSTGHRCKRDAIEKKLLARRLQANANRCRDEKVNEAGWINNVANLVLQRLDGFDLKCELCKGYLWLPHSLAQPQSSMETSTYLEGIRTHRICECGDFQRAERSIFSNRSDERVHHDKAGLESFDMDQKYKRPDRVYGLSITRSFWGFGGLSNYSPFTDKHTLFPFLLVEAKSGKTKDTFVDIEQQTALSIRTCLKIQKNLQIESGQHLDPLVWFIGFKGETWRVYVASYINEKTKVVDSWTGELRNENDALQVLIIVDLMCYWARNHHRKPILKCLTALEKRGLTPASTVYSYQGDPVSSRLSSPSNAHHDDVAPSPITIFDDTEDEDTPKFGSIAEQDDELMQDMDDFVSFTPEPSLSRPQPQNSDENRNVVRSISDTSFKWLYLVLPQDNDAMGRFLREAMTAPPDAPQDAPQDSIESIAKSLLQMMTNSSCTVKMDPSTIAEIFDSYFETPVSMFLASQRLFREPDWHVECVFWCIICSTQAAPLLARYANPSEPPPFKWDGFIWNDCDQVVSAITNLKRLEAKEAGVVTVSESVFYLQSVFNPGYSTTGLEWHQDEDPVTESRLILLSKVFGSHRHVRSNRGFPEALLHAMNTGPITMSRIIDINGLEGVPGLIIKKPDWWPQTSPLWCYLAWQTEQTQSVGHQISLALKKKAVYNGTGNFTSDEIVSISDWATAMDNVMLSIDSHP